MMTATARDALEDGGLKLVSRHCACNGGGVQCGLPSQQMPKRRKTPVSRVARAADAVHRAQQRLKRARLTLAKLTKPSHPPALVHSRAQWARALMERKTRSWLRQPGVLGYGLSHEEGVPHVVVYVARGQSCVLPKQLRGKVGQRLPVSTVELPVFEHCAAVGSSVGPTDPQEKGTIGAFARNADGTVFAITAMHVALRDELNEDDPPVPAFAPSKHDDAQAPRLGDFVLGTSNEVDVAKIMLRDPADAHLYVLGNGPVRGWRPVVDPSDKDTPVKMYGAVSRMQRGRIVTPNTDLPALNLRCAIVAEITSTRGDSGAALLDGQSLILGFLKGRWPGTPYAVFSSVGIALQRLGCDIPTDAT